MIEKNPLQERLENTIITKTFHISGMPEAIWTKVNDFCKLYYGDARWIMVDDLIRRVEEDYKFALISEEILAIKEEIALLKNKEVDPDKKPSKFKTFGSE